LKVNFEVFEVFCKSQQNKNRFPALASTSEAPLALTIFAPNATSSLSLSHPIHFKRGPGAKTWALRPPPKKGFEQQQATLCLISARPSLRLPHKLRTAG
jgi:hypothetical protein